jgi:hypothetical protein
MSSTRKAEKSGCPPGSSRNGHGGDVQPGSPSRRGRQGLAGAGNGGARKRQASLAKHRNFSSPSVARSGPGKEGDGPVRRGLREKELHRRRGGGWGAPPSTGLALTWRRWPANRVGATARGSRQPTGWPVSSGMPRLAVPHGATGLAGASGRVFRYSDMVRAVLLPLSPTVPLPECRAPLASRQDARLGPSRLRNWPCPASERLGR